MALRYGVGNRWLDLKLDLWRALSETVEKCARASRGAGSPDEFAVCRKGLLAESADVAYHTTGFFSLIIHSQIESFAEGSFAARGPQPLRFASWGTLRGTPRTFRNAIIGGAGGTGAR